MNQLQIGSVVATLDGKERIKEIYTITSVSKKTAYSHYKSFVREYNSIIHQRNQPKDKYKTIYFLASLPMLQEYSNRLERKNMEAQVSSLLEYATNEDLQRYFNELKIYLPF